MLGCHIDLAHDINQHLKTCRLPNKNKPDMIQIANIIYKKLIKLWLLNLMLERFKYQTNFFQNECILRVNDENEI